MNIESRQANPPSIDAGRRPLSAQEKAERPTQGG